MLNFRPSLSYSIKYTLLVLGRLLNRYIRYCASFVLLSVRISQYTAPIHLTVQRAKSLCHQIETQENEFFLTRRVFSIFSNNQNNKVNFQQCIEVLLINSQFMHFTEAHVSSEENNDSESVKHVPPIHVDCSKTLPGKMRRCFKIE